MCLRLALCAGGAALLLKLHGLPGYSRITTQAQLADRCAGAGQHSRAAALSKAAATHSVTSVLWTTTARLKAQQKARRGMHSQQNGKKHPA